MKRVHLHIRYVEKSDQMYKTKDFLEFVHKRLALKSDKEKNCVKSGTVHYYVTEPAFEAEKEKAKNAHNF